MLCSVDGGASRVTKIWTIVTTRGRNVDIRSITITRESRGLAIPMTVGRAGQTKQYQSDCFPCYDWTTGTYTLLYMGQAATSTNIAIGDVHAALRVYRTCHGVVWLIRSTELAEILSHYSGSDKWVTMHTVDECSLRFRSSGMEIKWVRETYAYLKFNLLLVDRGGSSSWIRVGTPR